MKNKNLAEIFYSIAEYLKVDDIPFKPQAYEKAAIALETIEEDAVEIYKKGGLKALEKIPGVGKSIAEKIEEYLKTGKIRYYNYLKKKLPIDLVGLIRVEGVGPKKAKILYQKLGVKNVSDLEKAAKKHKIASLSGFGGKIEKNITEGIEFLKRSQGRFLLSEILPEAESIYNKLKDLKEVEKVDIAGSVRRMKETIGDVDFLVISKNPEKVMDFFVSLPGIAKVWNKGATKASIRMKQGFDIDIRVVSPGQYGSALQYFIGSKEHNVNLRKIAIDKGMKLNEYGLFSAKGGPASGGRGKKMIAGRTEEEIYEKLGMAWIPPELREDRGEIEASLRQAPLGLSSGRRQGKPKGLPELIELKDIKGDLHVHCNWNGGVNSIEELANYAMEMGYEYIGISDHTKFLRIENGLDEKQLEKRNKEIDKINLKFSAKGGSASGGKIKNFKILKGCEANIMSDGSIDIKDSALEKLDYVIAGVHSQMKMTRQKMTERVIKAMQNPHVDIIAHPTGRILKRRDEFQVDFDKLLEVAKETGTIFEIDAYPDRLDLNDINIKKAKEAGVKMVINTDAHQKSQMNYMKYGVAQARRGWAEKKDIINTWNVKKLLGAMKNEKK